MLRSLVVAASLLLLLPVAAAAADPPVDGLPTGPRIAYGELVQRDGGFAVLVVDRQARTTRLFAGPVGGAPQQLGECGGVERQFSPAVSGSTVAWIPCPQLDDETIEPIDAFELFVDGGRRTVAAENILAGSIAIAGRTLAINDGIARGPQVRLVDLDTGAERIVRIPGAGRLRNTFDVQGQADGTVVFGASRSDQPEPLPCVDRPLYAVVAPGAATASAVSGIRCAPSVLVASSRLVFFDRASARLLVTALDGTQARALDRGLGTESESRLRTDGTSVSWTHVGCRSERAVTAPLDGSATDIGERCPVRVRSARLSRSRRIVSLRVRCPRGCRGAFVGLAAPRGAGLLVGVGRSRPGTATVRLRASRRLREARPGARVTVRVGDGPGGSLYGVQRQTVRLRGLERARSARSGEADFTLPRSGPAAG